MADITPGTLQVEDEGHPAPEVSIEDRVAAVEARLDRAAAAQVTGDAAKVRDGLKPTT